MANYENFYSGSNSPFQEEYSNNFPSYRSASRFGSTTNPQVANQIAEVNKLMNVGMKTIEMGSIDPEIFETIPQEHLKEINRLSKLTGEEITMHAPIQGMDPSGFGRGGWSPSSREEAERRLREVVIRSHDLNPDGNIPVTIHASELPARDIRKDEMVVAVNQEDWQLSALRREKKQLPEGEVMIDPVKELERHNKEYWTNHSTDLLYYQNLTDNEIHGASSTDLLTFGKIVEDISLHGNEDRKIKRGTLTDGEKQIYDEIESARMYENRVDEQFKNLFWKAWKFGNEETRKELRGIQEDWKDAESMRNPVEKARIMKNSIIKFKDITSSTPPEIFKPVEEFAINESSQTIGNIAFDAYSKFKDTSPIISLENWSPDKAFSSAEQLGRLVKESRNKFVEKAVSEGVSKSEAEKQAAKLIGATWDIGHLNMLRKGYSGEEAEKMMVEETRKIAPYVKHAHISDNFGHADTHLPPGMGNVPVKKLMEELEKKGFTGKQILEMGGYINQFKEIPISYSLESMNSPLYSMQASPTWREVRSQYGNQGYFSGGYGSALPEHHYSMYGTGFSTLPTELGGHTPGSGKRFSGTPME